MKERKNHDGIRLCIITPSFAGGGAERIAVNLSNFYADQGLTVCLIAFDGAGPYRKQVNDNVNVVVLGVRLRNSFYKVYSELKRQKPSHILSVLRGSNLVLGGVLSLTRGFRLVFREANTLSNIKRKPFITRFFYLLLLKLTYLRADMVIANSPDTKKDLVDCKVKNGYKIAVIPNPVLQSGYALKMSEELNESWIDEGYKIVLNVGRLHFQKNQRSLIEAFEKVLLAVPSSRLIIIGEGELRDELQSLIKVRGLSDFVKILSFQENPWPYYKAANLFVLTSEWEGFGNVIVEALACGTPVISTDCPGGPRYILDNGRYGVLVRVGDNEDLERNIIDMLVQIKPCFRREDLVERSKEFSVRAVAERYLDVIVGD